MKLVPTGMGWEEVIRYFQQLGRTAPRTNVGAGVSGYNTNTKGNKRKGKEPPKAKAYALIANAQAKEGRNPFFLTEKEEREMDDLMLQLCNAWISGNDGAVIMHVKRMADLYDKSVRQHIENGISINGPMKPISDRSNDIKEKTYKAVGKPILVRTGGLLESIGGAWLIRKGGR